LQVGKGEPPTPGEAIAIARGVAPDLTQNVADRVKLLFDIPQLALGLGPAAFDALTQIAQARREGWDWRAAGAIDVGPATDLQASVSVPWWIVVHLVEGWRAFALDGGYRSLDEAFEVKAQRDGLFRVRRKKHVDMAARAIEVADLIEQGVSQAAAVAAVADKHEVDERTVLNNFNRFRDPLSRNFPAVARLNALRKSDP